MNRSQRENVQELGRSISEAIEALAENLTARKIPMERELTEAIEEEICSVEYEDTIPDPQPVEDNRNMLAPYEVIIKQVHNGFIVSVGCQTFVFETFDKMSMYMEMYFKNPSETTETHYAGKLFGN